MTKSDIDKLFSFFQSLRPNIAYNPVIRRAWELVLAPYTFEDALDAACEYLRQNRYLPDPSDIAIAIDARKEPAPPGEPDTAASTVISPADSERLKGYAEIRRRRKEAGLPESIAAARQQGHSAVEVADMYIAAGLGTLSLYAQA